MRYIKVEIEYEPKITGSPNGVYAVEINDRKSYKLKDEKNYFNEFILKNNNDIKRVCEDNFVTIDNKKISEIIFFRSYKRTRDIDVIQYCPHLMGFQLLLSEQAYKILEKYKTPTLNILPSHIDTFNERYFLIGFPMIENKMIDFAKSTFYDYKLEQELTYENFDEYSEINFSIYPLEIHLTRYYDYDIINLQGEGMYFSESLIQELEDDKIIGFVRKKAILFNESE